MQGVRAICGGLLAAFVAANPALAGRFTPPETCTGYVTVQMKGCMLSNHYRCSGDAPGDQWRVEFGQTEDGEDAAMFQARIDADAQWVESQNLRRGTVEYLLPGAADPASLSRLLSEGYDSFDFQVQAADGLRETIRGFDRLTGERVRIDGVALLGTQFEARATDESGATLWHTRGAEFLHPDWRIFLSGRGEWLDVETGEFLPFDATPLSFSFPGEVGFFSTTPLFECDTVMSQAPATAPFVLPVSASQGSDLPVQEMQDDL
ncbi:MAG: hypothetical protein NWQ69_02570 [Paracoccaceae bacterium]|jgi:hypothetical protein|nr:hypothetical protein [Paracoccaceae bacterium]